MMVIFFPILCSGQTDVEGGISDRSPDKLPARDSMVMFYVMSTRQHFASAAPNCNLYGSRPFPFFTFNIISVLQYILSSQVLLTTFLTIDTIHTAMKFGSVVLSTALLMTTAKAFSVAPIITSISSTRTQCGALKMAASTEFINGEARPKKTREVSCSYLYLFTIAFGLNCMELHADSLLSPLSIVSHS